MGVFHTHPTPSKDGLLSVASPGSGSGTQSFPSTPPRLELGRPRLQARDLFVVERLPFGARGCGRTARGTAAAPPEVAVPFNLPLVQEAGSPCSSWVSPAEGENCGEGTAGFSPLNRPPPDRPVGGGETLSRSPVRLESASGGSLGACVPPPLRRCHGASSSPSFRPLSAGGSL
jgi:hypothetical protein